MRRIVLLSLLALALSFPAQAQVNDNRDLFDRVDRLERDIQTLQFQLSRGGVPAAGAAAPAAAAPAAAAPVTPGRAAQLDERVDQLEDMVRQLIGRLDETNHAASLTQKQLDRMQADIDLRFKELGGGGPAAPGAAAPAAPAAPPQPGVSMPAPSGGVLTPPKNSADGPGLAPGPQVLGVLPAQDARQPAAAPPPGKAPVLIPPASVLAKDPKAMYDDAYDKERAGDTAGAEAGFKAFLAKFPNHALASDAQFWLADMVFSRQDYRNSAAAFLEAYKKYPTSTKAPDMLLKASQSFAKLDPPDNPDACKTLTLLFGNHPNMADHVRRAATQEKQKLGCK